MGRVANALTRVRDIVNDVSGSRWSDATLLRIYNEGQQDIARHTEMLRDTAHIALSAGVHTYNLPNDLIRVLRVIYDNQALPIVSHNDLDHPPITGNTISSVTDRAGYSRSSFETTLSPTWITDTTEDSVSAVILDKLNRHKVRVYPRPVGILTETFEVGTYGVTVSAIDDEDTFTFDSLYGVPVSVVDTDVESDSLDTTEGVIGSFSSTKSLIIYYSRRPADIVEDQINVADPEIDTQWDTALIRYVAGNALIEDVKEQNRSMGREQLTFYDREIGKAEEVAKSDSTSADHFQTRYNGMG